MESPAGWTIHAIGLKSRTMRASWGLGLSVVLLISAAVGLAVVEYAPELYSLGWHQLHRGMARFTSETRTVYELKVPVSFSAFRPDECSVTVEKQAGPIRSRFVRQSASQMSFSACPTGATAKTIEANAAKLTAELGIVTIPREAISVAGQQLQCYERLGGRETQQATQLATVDCVPLSSEGELSASFVGTDDHLQAFYSLLKAVRRLEID